MILRVLYLTLVTIPFVLIGAPAQFVLIKAAPRLSHLLPQLFLRLVTFGLGLRITVYGRPAPGPVLLLSNHISWLDIVAIGARVPVRFVAKSEVAAYPLVGLFARLQRTIFVDRAKRTATGRTAAEMGDALGAGDPVLLFAEGTSDIGTHVLPFKSALIGAAEKAMNRTGGENIAIQPVAIAYTAISGLSLSRHERDKIAWIGDMGLGDNLGAILGSGPKSIAIAFGAPLPVAGDRKALTRRVETRVRQMLVALNRGLALPSPED